jgi:hypothetical protein
MLRSRVLNRLLLAGLLGAVAAYGAIWPSQFGELKRTSSALPAVQDRPLWDEYGLEEAETARYSDGARQFEGTAYRLKDPTSAFAAFESIRPAGSQPSKLTDAAAETGDGVLFVFGNYLFEFQGWKPQLNELAGLLGQLPKLDQSPVPNSYLPSRGLVANSERYILGPEGLDRFEPGLPPSVAAFSMGAEGQLAQYETGAGRVQMAVFSYPTPQIARQRLEVFQKLSGAMAKRAGPLVAVILAPRDPNAAERLLSYVTYRATITVDERVPTGRDNVGDLMVNIFILVGIILAITIPAGVVVGVLRHLGWGTSGDPMTLLHLEDQPREGAAGPDHQP